MRFSVAIAVLGLGALVVSASAQELPADAKQLLGEHAASVAKLNDVLTEKLNRLREKHARVVNLPAANAIDDWLKDHAAHAPTDGKKLATDPACGRWDFLGVAQQRINGFVFGSDGTVEAENIYTSATWTRLDPKTVVFRYSDTEGGSTIVFHAQEDEERMRGFNSINGKVRYMHRPE